jgi:hypothetical protein
MVKRLVKICQAIADFILRNLDGCRVKWGAKKDGE